VEDLLSDSRTILNGSWTSRQ